MKDEGDNFPFLSKMWTGWLVTVCRVSWVENILYRVSQKLFIGKMAITSLKLKIWTEFTAHSLHSFVSFCIAQWATSLLSMRSLENIFVKKMFLKVWRVAGRPKKAEKMQKDAKEINTFNTFNILNFYVGFSILLEFFYVTHGGSNRRWLESKYKINMLSAPKDCWRMLSWILMRSKSWPRPGWYLPALTIEMSERTWQSFLQLLLN